MDGGHPRGRESAVVDEGRRLQTTCALRAPRSLRSVSWLRRWDRRHTEWAERTNDEWANVPKVDGVPVERPDPVKDAYVRYLVTRLVVVGVGSVAGVVALLIRFPAYAVGASLALIAAAAVLFVVYR